MQEPMSTKVEGTGAARQYDGSDGDTDIVMGQTRPQRTRQQKGPSQYASSFFLNKSDFEDPVTYEVMADPVTCQGKTGVP